MWWVLYMLYFQIFFFLWLSRVFALDHHGRQKMFPTWIMSLPKIEFPFDASSQQNHISLCSVKIQPFPLVSTCLLCCTCFLFPVSMIKWTLCRRKFRRNANDVAYSFFSHFINNGYILSSISCACIYVGIRENFNVSHRLMYRNGMLKGSFVLALPTFELDVKIETKERPNSFESTLICWENPIHA